MNYRIIKDTTKSAIGTRFSAAVCATPNELVSILGAVPVIDGEPSYQWKKEYHDDVLCVYFHNAEDEEINPDVYYRFSIASVSKRAGQDLQEVIVMDLVELRNSEKPVMNRQQRIDSFKKELADLMEKHGVGAIFCIGGDPEMPDEGMDAIFKDEDETFRLSHVPNEASPESIRSTLSQQS